MTEVTGRFSFLGSHLPHAEVPNMTKLKCGELLSAKPPSVRLSFTEKRGCRIRSWILGLRDCHSVVGSVLTIEKHEFLDVCFSKCRICADIIGADFIAGPCGGDGADCVCTVRDGGRVSKL